MRSFHETLSQLRRERNINQRTAAAELGISQALLSHYENGVREPGLAFVCRVCDYYSVSADYLLCRTSMRDPSIELGQTMKNGIYSLRELLDGSERSLERLLTKDGEDTTE